MSEPKKSSLGKGLSALVDEQVLGSFSEESAGKVLMVPSDKIIPSRHQPRKEFEEGALAELAESITRHGVIQPLVVSDLGSGQYELIAGERRLRASNLAGLSEVPVILREYADRDRLAIALIENIQRSDLNAIEVAEAYREMQERLNTTQEDIAAMVGKSRTSVANTLRLLRLPPSIREQVLAGILSEGHGRAILGLEDAARIPALVEGILEQELSVRQTEELIRELNLHKDSAPPPVEPPKAAPKKRDIQLELLEEKLVRDLGLKVEIQGSLKKGTVKVSYYTEGDLENFLQYFAHL